MTIRFQFLISRRLGGSGLRFEITPSVKAFPVICVPVSCGVVEERGKVKLVILPMNLT